MTSPAGAFPTTPPGPPPLVSVIVVNWNGEAYLEECLASLARQSYSDLEVIVVDNGSTDSSLALLRAAASERVTVIEARRNLGFAGGNNLGIRAAMGTYVALLNTDAVAEPGWVEALVRGASADPRVGMCASKIFLYGQPGVLDGAGLLISADGIGRGRGRLERDGPAFAREEDVLLPSGCAALYRRAMLDEIGVFDEEFFAYCEDSDLGLRARIAGWRCRYVPEAVVYHRYSGSTAPYSAFKAFQVERNRIWVVAKCFPLRLLPASLLGTIARYALQAYGVLRGQGASARFAEHVSWVTILTVIIRAWVAALAQLPLMLRRRRHVYALQRVSSREIVHWLRAHRVGLGEVALKN
ncbi:MAG: glycosyltransferase family 2 protein [Tepidiformaceae bacterium]